MLSLLHRIHETSGSMQAMRLLLRQETIASSLDTCLPSSSLSLVHESSRIFETKIRKSGSAEGSRPLLGFGVSPKNPFSLFFSRRRRRRERGREVGHSPTPQAKGWLPFAIPLDKGLDVHRTSVRKIRDDSCLRR